MNVNVRGASAPEEVIRGFLGATVVSTGQMKGPGLKPIVMESYFQGSEDPCSLREKRMSRRWHKCEQALERSPYRVRANPELL